MNRAEDNLPELPESWAWTQVREVCLSPQYGWTTSAVAEGTLKLLRTTDITSGRIDWESVPFCKKEPPDKGKYVLKHGDIVISRAGSVGYSLLIQKPEEAVFASYLIRFRPLIDEFYLAYFLKSPFYWGAISEKKLGIAVPNVNASKLKEIQVPLPPLAEQKRIVAKIEELFTRLDAGVEAMKKIKAQLKRYRQAVLKHAFEGKLTAKWREKNKDKLEPASVLLERIKKECEKTGKRKIKKLPALDTSELPELPEGWEWARLRDACLVQGGYAFKSKDYKSEGIPLVRISNIRDKGVNLSDNVVFIDEKFEDEYSNFLLRKGDVLVALSGATTGKYGLHNTTCKALLNQRVGRLRLYSEKLLIKYFFYFLGIIKQAVLKRAYGAAQPNISTTELSHFAIPFAPLAEQRQVVEEVERRFSVADEIEKAVEQGLGQAEALRQSILKRAFEGKLVPQDPSDEPAEKLLERIKKSQQANSTRHPLVRKRGKQEV